MGTPQEFYSMGFNMILYPTTVLFRDTRTIQRSLAGLKADLPMPENDSVAMSNHLSYLLLYLIVVKTPNARGLFFATEMSSVCSPGLFTK